MSTTDRETAVASSANGAKPRTAAEIEADIVAARDNLANSLDQIGERVRPANVAKRAGAKARGVVQKPDGSPKVTNIAVIVGVVALLVVYRVRKSRIG